MEVDHCHENIRILVYVCKRQSDQWEWRHTLLLQNELHIIVTVALCKSHGDGPCFSSSMNRGVFVGLGVTASNIAQRINSWKSQLRLRFDQFQWLNPDVFSLDNLVSQVMSQKLSCR